APTTALRVLVLRVVLLADGDRGLCPGGRREDRRLRGGTGIVTKHLTEQSRASLPTQLMTPHVGDQRRPPGGVQILRGERHGLVPVVVGDATDGRELAAHRISSI